MKTSPTAGVQYPVKPIAEINANVKIKFAAQHLPRAALFAGVNDIRYYLNGARIEPAPMGGVYIIGCDGHCLAIIHDKMGCMSGSTGVILRVSPGLLQACKSPGRELKGLTGGANVIITGSRVSVANDFDQDFTSLEVFVQAGQPWIDGTFPDYARVLPDFSKLKPGFNCSVNGHYLARFAKISPNSGKNYSGLKFWQEPVIGNHTGPVLIQHDGVPEMIALVMPMHTDEYELNQYRKLFEQFPAKPPKAPLPDQQPSDAAPT
ncbi:hypothetical protein BH10PSE16_BH10PSE16_01380 [soil metagenome]